MNGKFDEKLAQLAFGDMTPEEAARIEAQVRQDPAASARLAEYREMRASLSGLSAVPDHQLSNERLRDAILAQGLRPKAVEPSSPGLGRGWLWMPVAACALGFGLIVLRHAPQGAPVVVMDEAKHASVPTVAFNEPKTFHQVTPAVPTTHVETTQANPVEKSSVEGVAVHLASSRHEEPSRRRRARHPRFSPGTTPVPAFFPSVTEPRVPSGAVALNQNPPPTTQPTSNPALDSAAGTPSSPIVLIDSNPDAQTGAPTATEVGTVSNVVVGG